MFPLKGSVKQRYPYQIPLSNRVSPIRKQMSPIVPVPRGQMTGTTEGNRFG